jgi:hypothetical protein
MSSTRSCLPAVRVKSSRELGHSGGERDLTGGRSLADFVAAFVPRLRAGGYSYIAEHASTPSSTSRRRKTACAHSSSAST